MSHFGRSGPPDIRDTYSLLVLNITFRTSADDLFPLFDRYGKVVDIFIPRDRRSGDSRGFAFVRYKHVHEAQKAVDRLDGKNVDGRNIVVQFAKYGREMEYIQRGRITQENIKWKRSRSRSPRRSSGRDRNDSWEKDRRGGRGSDRYDPDSYQERNRGYRRRSRSATSSRSRSYSPREDDRRHPRSRTPDRKTSPIKRRSRPLPERSLSPVSNSHSPQTGGSPKRGRVSISPAGRKISPRVLSRSRSIDRSRSATPEPHSRSVSLNSDAEDH